MSITKISVKSPWLSAPIFFRKIDKGLPITASIMGLNVGQSEEIPFHVEHLRHVDTDGHSADNLLRRRVGYGKTELGLEHLGRLVFLNFADMDGIGTDIEGLLPFRLVALPVIGRHVALTNVEALVVHHEDFREKPLAVRPDLLHKARQGAGHNGVDHGLCGRLGLGPPRLVETVDIGLGKGSMLGVLGLDGLNYGRTVDPCQGFPVGQALHRGLMLMSDGDGTCEHDGHGGTDRNF